MPDEFGGIPVDSGPTDEFGGVPVSNTGSAAPSTPDKPVSQALGFYEGVSKPISNLASAMDTISQHLGVDVNSVAGMLGLPRVPTASDLMKESSDWAQQQPYKPGSLGKFAGEMVGTAPVLALTTNPFGAGALSAGLLSDEKTPQGVAADMAIGAGLGKIGDVVLGAAGNALKKPLQTSPFVQKLLNEGVELTPGQIAGGIAKRFEDAATSLPFVGDAIKSAQNRATQTFNRAALNRALKPIGQSLPQGVSGRDAIDHVYKAIGDKYDSLLPNMTGTADPQLTQDISAIGQNAIGQGSKQDVLDRFNNVMQAQIGSRFQNGQMTGQALKDAQSNLGNIGRRLSSSQDSDDRQLGSMVMDAQQAFNDMLERNNPNYGKELKAANNAYAQYARLRKAASYVGANEGTFTAPQLARAVQASDRSAGKGAYARGQAMMQDLSEAGKAVLPSTINDSGTATRLLLTDPVSAVSGLAASIPTRLAYSRPVQRALTSALTSQRPASLQSIGDLVLAGRAPATLGASSLADLVPMGDVFGGQAPPSLRPPP